MSACSVVEDRFSAALQEATDVDEMIRSRPDPEHWARSKPLLGVPMSIKETIGVAGKSLVLILQPIQ